MKTANIPENLGANLAAHTKLVNRIHSAHNNYFNTVTAWCLSWLNVDVMEAARSTLRQDVFRDGKPLLPQGCSITITDVGVYLEITMSEPVTPQAGEKLLPGAGVSFTAATRWFKAAVVKDGIIVDTLPLTLQKSDYEPEDVMRAALTIAELIGKITDVVEPFLPIMGFKSNLHISE